MRAAARGRAGYTLVEMLLAIGVLGLLFGSIGMIAKSSQDSMSAQSTNARLDARLRSGIAAITERLRDAGADRTSPQPAAPFCTSSVGFACAESFEDGATTWGDAQRIEFQYSPTDPDDGVDNDGNGLIDDGRVVWIEDDGTPDARTHVLCRYVPELSSGEEDNGLDDDGNGLIDEPGLAIAFDGRCCTVQLTISARDHTGRVYTKTATRSVALHDED